MSSTIAGDGSGIVRSQRGWPFRRTVAVWWRGEGWRFTTNSASSLVLVAWMRIPEMSPSSRGLGDARDDRQRELGPREVRGVDDKPVGQTQQVAERPRTERRRSGPPEKHRKVRHEQRDHRGREAILDVAVRADEDLLVANEAGAVRDRQPAMHLDALVHALARAAVDENDDRARWMAERQVRDASGRATRVLLAVGVHHEVG